MLQDQEKAERAEKEEFLADLLYLSDVQFLVVTPEEVFPGCINILMTRKDLKENTVHYRQCIRAISNALRAVLPVVVKTVPTAL